MFGQELGHKIRLFFVAFFIVDHLDLVVVALSESEVLAEEQKNIVECLIQNSDIEMARNRHVNNGDSQNKNTKQENMKEPVPMGS